MSWISSFNAYVLYPVAERWERRDIRRKRHALDWEMALPFSLRRQMARCRLAETLRKAAREVPYYRDLFRGRDLADPLAWWEEVPFLTKDIIRGEGRRLLSEVVSGPLHLRKTGGSTGPSAAIYYSDEALDWTAAADRLVGGWAGRPPYRREVHLSSRFPARFPWRDRLKERIKRAALNRTNLLTDSFDDAALEKLWRDLRRARPYLVQGHPSTLYALALHVRRCGHPTGSFPLFESTGETLDGRKRQVIAETFGCRIVNRYGSAEFGVAAFTAPGDGPERLLVLDSMAWPETVEQTGGDRELVFTSLRNEAMPLIRYRTGDLGELTETDEGFFLTNLRGRLHDVIRIGNRSYPTHYVQDLLDRLGRVDEFQFELVPGKRPLLRLAVATPADQPVVEQAVRRWWGEDLGIEFTSLDRFHRQGERNKFRYVVEPSVGQEAA